MTTPAGGDDASRAECRRRLEQVWRAGGRGRLFAVGCARGGLLLEAGALGFEASGLEPEPDLARAAAERSGRPVRAGTLADVLLAPVGFDVITLFDGLHGLPDPGTTLRRLRVALAPGGLLAVTVPDSGGPWAHALGARWPLHDPRPGGVRFTRRSLVRALGTAGFEDVSFRPARTALAPGAVVPAAWQSRAVWLPFGTLFALARAPRID